MLGIKPTIDEIKAQLAKEKLFTKFASADGTVPKLFTQRTNSEFVNNPSGYPEGTPFSVTWIEESSMGDGLIFRIAYFDRDKNPIDRLEFAKHWGKAHAHSMYIPESYIEWLPVGNGKYVVSGGLKTPIYNYVINHIGNLIRIA